MEEKEKIILKALLDNEEYCKACLHHLKTDYFESFSTKRIFLHTKAYVTKYNSIPTIEALQISLSRDNAILEENFDSIQNDLTAIKNANTQSDEKWLLEETEIFCQEKSVFRAMAKCINILEGEDKKYSKNAIPELLMDALSVSFNISIGHDFLNDAERRYNYYHNNEKRIKTHLPYLDLITGNGFPIKTLNIFLAGPHAGKTSLMCSLACDNLRHGENVLYVTLEMAEEEIAKRIEANLLDVDLNEIKNLSKETYFNKINTIKKETTGRLIIKEFPASTTNCSVLSQLLRELHLKQNFKPDVIYVDYLNLLRSAHLKIGSANSYEYIKNITIELRDLAISQEVPLITATQLRREGNSNENPTMEDISESFAVNFTADFMCGMIATQDLRERNIVLFKQLKNRFSDYNENSKCAVTFDRKKMRFINDSEFVNAAVMDRLSTDNNGRDIDGFKF